MAIASPDPRPTSRDQRGIQCAVQVAVASFRLQCAWVLPVDVIREAAAQEVDDRLRELVLGANVRAAIPVVDLALVRQSLNPKLRDAAVADFPLRIVGVLGFPPFDEVRDVTTDLNLLRIRAISIESGSAGVPRNDVKTAIPSQIQSGNNWLSRGRSVMITWRRK